MKQETLKPTRTQTKLKPWVQNYLSCSNSPNAQKGAPVQIVNRDRINHHETEFLDGQGGLSLVLKCPNISKNGGSSSVLCVRVVFSLKGCVSHTNTSPLILPLLHEMNHHKTCCLSLKFGFPKSV